MTRWSAGRGHGQRRRTAVSALVVGMVISAVGGLVACSSGDGGPDPDELPAEAAEGLRVAQRFNCTGCHSSDGSDSVGPTWKGLAGSERPLLDGGSVVADDDYLRQSIEEPNARVIDGFRSTMPAQELSAEQIHAVIAYITALSED